jgi:hypothetical protein
MSREPPIHGKPADGEAVLRGQVDFLTNGVDARRVIAMDAH